LKAFKALFCVKYSNAQFKVLEGKLTVKDRILNLTLRRLETRATIGTP